MKKLSFILGVILMTAMIMTALLTSCNTPNSGSSDTTQKPGANMTGADTSDTAQSENTEPKDTETNDTETNDTETEKDAVMPTIKGKELKLWYNEPAPDDDQGSTKGTGSYYTDVKQFVGWEDYALPLGNGYMGAMVFGQTEHERVQLTHNALSSRDPGDSDIGLGNFAETYLDFPHPWSGVSDYYRDLDLNTATANVRYTYDGVTYAREYITSYPNHVMAIRLTASEKGKISFTLRPTIPYMEGNYPQTVARTGKIVAEGDTITMSGTYGVHNVQYMGLFKVVPEGGSMTAQNVDGDKGTITVTGADSVVIYITLGTNCPIGDSEIFLKTDSQKLSGYTIDEAELRSYVNKAAVKGWDAVYTAHVADFYGIFGRVRLDLASEVPTIPMDELLAEYKKSSAKNGIEPNVYLEEVFFQYGRYLLISSSREGGLPANLQGIWNRYYSSVCGAGYWHNINTQMNYWPAFSTNMAETFEPYVDYFNAIYPTLLRDSANVVWSVSPENYDSNNDNGWNIGTGLRAYYAYAETGNSFSGYGGGGLTAEMFWDYYQFTQDETILKDIVYPTVLGNANFMSRIVKLQEDGTYLTIETGSPENHVSFKPNGTTYDQSMAYDSMTHALQASQILGIDIASNAILSRIQNIVDKLDPINIGATGQLKEFREESTYSQFGEYSHRHISHLLGLYPGTLINENVPAWLDAATVSLTKRGDRNSCAWAMANRLCAWARVKDGDHAYAVLQQILKNTTNENLFEVLNDTFFQIDGNFGSTAGIAEMLLQSHEGYIYPLAALPSSWESGEYSGLVARGAFEVGAQWENGQAILFTILSENGGSCKVRYPNLAGAKVTDSKGNTVSFAAEGTDYITFDTVVGETYTISDIPASKKVAPAVRPKAKTTAETVSLTWTASADAVSYRVYVAWGDEPNYTLLGEVSEEAYLYTHNGTRTERATFAVTAVNEDGRESLRATVNVNPA